MRDTMLIKVWKINRVRNFDFCKIYWQILYHEDTLYRCKLSKLGDVFKFSDFIEEQAKVAQEKFPPYQMLNRAVYLVSTHRGSTLVSGINHTAFNSFLSKEVITQTNQHILSILKCSCFQNKKNNVCTGQSHTGGTAKYGGFHLNTIFCIHVIRLAFSCSADDFKC